MTCMFKPVSNRLPIGGGCIVVIIAFSVALGACGQDPLRDPSLEGEVAFEPRRPAVQLPPSSPKRYEGSHPVVLDAASRLRTGMDLHRSVIQRTCSPTDGVCHNNAEYPDLRTPSSLLATVEAPCNVEPGTATAVFDRCERPGDRLTFSEGRDTPVGPTGGWEVGRIKYVPGEFDDVVLARDGTGPAVDTPGLHLWVAAPVDGEASNFVASGYLHRGDTSQAPFVSFRTRYWVFEDRRHLFAEVKSYQTRNVQELLAAGVIEGDPNGNGVFGARSGRRVPMIRPGAPEESYLIGRLNGRMAGEDVPGTRMPLANQPLSPADKLALYCFIEGLPMDSASTGESVETHVMESPIDYASCSYAAEPERLKSLMGVKGPNEAVRATLTANCLGCHSGPMSSGELDLAGPSGSLDLRQLFQPSRQRPGMSLVDPGQVDASYLWIKLTEAPETVGTGMPIGSDGMFRRLNDEDLAAVREWIASGAQI